MTHHDIALTGYWILGIAIGLILLWVFFLWARLCWRAAGDVFGRVQKVPSPPQVAAALANEWGRQPTVQEVQAVHQLLQSEHDRALVAAGALSLGGLYLLAH
jgi:hypothetical protein